MYTSLLQMLNPSARAGTMSASSTPLANSASTSSSSSSSTTDPGVDLTSTFLQLLSVQLQNQSPLDPIDPNQFTMQLATFDSLGELTQIQELMQTLVNDVGGTSSSSSIASASANLIPTASLNSISH